MIISTAVVVLVAAGVGAYLGLRGDGDSSGASAGHQATDKTGTAVVSADDPVAEIAGVRIDANALNLLDGEKTLTVTARSLSVTRKTSVPMWSTTSIWEGLTSSWLPLPSPFPSMPSWSAKAGRA